MITEKSRMRTGIVFLDIREYHYFPRKEWDAKKPRVIVIITNPSATGIIALDYITLYIINNISSSDF